MGQILGSNCYQVTQCEVGVSSIQCSRSTVMAHVHSVINPRRACAARVTVLGLSVCLSVCLSTLILAVQATRRPMSDTSSLRAMKA